MEAAGSYSRGTGKILKISKSYVASPARRSLSRRSCDLAENRAGAKASEAYRNQRQVTPAPQRELPAPAVLAVSVVVFIITLGTAQAQSGPPRGSSFYG